MKCVVAERYDSIFYSFILRSKQCVEDTSDVLVFGVLVTAQARVLLIT